jgi:hypothetical protein
LLLVSATLAASASPAKKALLIEIVVACSARSH